MLFLIICIVIILLLFLLSFIFHYFLNDQERYNGALYQFYLDNFGRLPDNIIINYYNRLHNKIVENDLRIYLNQVKDGIAAMRDKRLVLAGLIRNSKNNIPFIKSFYDELRSYFRGSVFLIVENNSSDGTRSALFNWKMNDPSIMILCDQDLVEDRRECVLGGFETFYVEKIPHSERIKKLSYLRNIYLKYAREKLGDHDYLAVMDLDLKGNFFMDGILQSFHYMARNPSISAISCNGLIKDKKKYKYYDSFAYVELGGSIEWDTTFDKSSHDYDVLEYTTKKYMRDLKMDRVVSAFGGFCIYHLNKLIQSEATYSYSRDEKLSCEHSHLHRQLDDVFVNPRMMFFIDDKN